ncbi:hypothetical protein YC2023_010850 [Brassica napus]
MWKHETSRRVLRLQSFNFGQVKTFMILVKSKWILTSRFLVWLAPSNTSFPLDLCVISSNRSRLLLSWTGASHLSTNWLREHQQPSASAVQPFDPPFLPLLDLCVISSNN